MSVKITALVWELSLPLPDKMVLLRMADYADDRGGSIYPAVATIAHYCEMSPRAVQYTLKKYLDDGLLIVLGNEKGGRGKTRVYAFDLDRLGQIVGPKGGKNGTGERAQTPQTPQTQCTLSDAEETLQTVQRVQNNAAKGANLMHPTRHRESIEEGGESRALACEGDDRVKEVARQIATLSGVPSTKGNRRIVAGWISEGADPDTDIIPGVEDTLRTTKIPLSEIRGFGLFGSAVENRKERRLNPQPVSAPNVHPIRPSSQQHRGHQGRATGGVAAMRVLARILEDED